MKTTLDLPDELVTQLKLRAVHERKKLKDLVAATLRAGLAASKRRPARPGKRGGVTVRKDRKTGLPVVQCRRAAPRGQELTPDRVAGILTEQEAAWAHDAG
jgi:hypothetical protein